MLSTVKSAPLHLLPYFKVYCRYLYTELSDASFGDRASAVLGRFRDADPSSEAMQTLAIQGQMMAQLSYIVDQLKARYSFMCPTAAAAAAACLLLTE